MLLTSLPWGCCLVNDGRTHVEHRGWRLLRPGHSRSPNCPPQPATARNAAFGHDGVMRQTLTLCTRLPVFTHRRSDDERVSLHPPGSFWSRVKLLQVEHVSANQPSGHKHAGTRLCQHAHFDAPQLVRRCSVRPQSLRRAVSVFAAASWESRT